MPEGTSPIIVKIIYLKKIKYNSLSTNLPWKTHVFFGVVYTNEGVIPKNKGGNEQKLQRCVFQFHHTDILNHWLDLIKAMVHQYHYWYVIREAIWKELRSCDTFQHIKQ